MKFTKVQRIEFLLEEIKEILQTIKDDSSEGSQAEQKPVEAEIVVPEAGSNRGTNTAYSTTTDTDSQSSSSDSSERDLPDLCVRCLNSWEPLISAGQYDLPNCEFDGGPRRKKCRYCSSRRSECVKVSEQHTRNLYLQNTYKRLKLPLSIRRPVIRRKAELHRVALQEEPREIGREQMRFAETFFIAHSKAKGTLSSEERKRRRNRAAVQRAEQKRQRVEASVAEEARGVEEQQNGNSCN